MNSTMAARFREAIESGDSEKLASTERWFRKRGQKVSEVLNKLWEIREEYYAAAGELEKARLELERKKVKTTYCKPRQSGKSKVKVEMSVEQLLASLTPEQCSQLLETLQGCACVENK